MVRYGWFVLISVFVVLAAVLESWRRQRELRNQPDLMARLRAVYKVKV